MKTIISALVFTAALVGCDAIDTTTDTVPRNGDDIECPTACTRTQGFWKTHNVHAAQQQKQTPWPIPEDTLLCGETWYDLLHTPVNGDNWLNLAHQWIAAMLNVAANSPAGDACDVCPGIELTPEVADALLEGKLLLQTCSVTDEQWAAYAEDLKDTLDAFNNGNKGVPHCDNI